MTELWTVTYERFATLGVTHNRGGTEAIAGGARVAESGARSRLLTLHSTPWDELHDIRASEIRALFL